MIPPAAVIVLRALRSIVNEDPTDRLLRDWQVEANEYLDRLDALLARVEPPVSILTIDDWITRIEQSLYSKSGNTFTPDQIARLHLVVETMLQSATARVEPPPQEQDRGLSATDIYHVMLAW